MADRAEQASGHGTILGGSWAAVGGAILVGVASGRFHAVFITLFGAAALVNGIIGLWRKRLSTVLTIILSIFLLDMFGPLLPMAVGRLQSSSIPGARAAAMRVVVLTVLGIYSLVVAGVPGFVNGIRSLSQGRLSRVLAIIVSLIVLVVTGPLLAIALGSSPTIWERTPAIQLVALISLLVLLSLYTLVTMIVFTKRAQKTDRERMASALPRVTSDKTAVVHPGRTAVDRRPPETGEAPVEDVVPTKVDLNALGGDVRRLADLGTRFDLGYSLKEAIKRFEAVGREFTVGDLERFVAIGRRGGWQDFRPWMKVFSFLNLFIYPVIASVYSGIRALVNGQPVIRFDCILEPAYPGCHFPHFGFYMGAFILLPLFVYLPLRIVSSWPDRYAPEGTLFGALRDVLRTLSVLWGLVLTCGGGAILSVELVARGRLPGVLCSLGYIVIGIFVVMAAISTVVQTKTTKILFFVWSSLFAAFFTLAALAPLMRLRPPWEFEGFSGGATAWFGGGLFLWAMMTMLIAFVLWAARLLRAPRRARAARS